MAVTRAEKKKHTSAIFLSCRRRSKPPPTLEEREENLVLGSKWTTRNHKCRAQPPDTASLECLGRRVIELGQSGWSSTTWLADFLVEHRMIVLCVAGTIEEGWRCLSCVGATRSSSREDVPCKRRDPRARSTSWKRQSGGAFSGFIEKKSGHFPCVKCCSPIPRPSPPRLASARTLPWHRSCTSLSEKWRSMDVLGVVSLVSREAMLRVEPTRVVEYSALA